MYKRQTSTKAVLFNKAGQVLATETIFYPLHTPTPLTAEQDPEEIFRAVLGTVRETIRKSAIDPATLKLVSFSSAMHSLIAVDAEDQLLTESITWADSRAAKHATRIKEEMDGHSIYLRTGTPIHAMSPLSKIVWLKEDKPEIFGQTAMFADIKSFVFHKLFGEYVVDHSIASATGLFNLENLDWDLSLIHISEPTRLGMISYAVFCLKKKNTHLRAHETRGNLVCRLLLEKKKKKKKKYMLCAV